MSEIHPEKLSGKTLSLHCDRNPKSLTTSLPGPVPIRLVDGQTMCSGRVEVLHSSIWGSVCGDHWGMEEASVVCRLLNCGDATSATGNATFGQGTGRVWLSDVRCNGTEAALDQCPAKPYGNNNCHHSQDAGIICSGKEISPALFSLIQLNFLITEPHWTWQQRWIIIEPKPKSFLPPSLSGPVPVRLVDGNNMCSGRVEVLHNSTWGSVCGDRWDKKGASVVCRALNCGGARSATVNATFGNDTGPIWLSNLRCEGTEAAVDQCSSNPWNTNSCNDRQVATITCSGPVPVRLVNGNNMCSGRVEVLHDTIWGTVCGDHWGTQEANVVCRLLNCGEATSATGNASFGQGTGPVWLSDVRCNGTEAALDQCPAKPYGINTCHHSQDASVTCSGPIPVRLVNGNNMCSGRLEVFHNSSWGSVCGDHWGAEEASVVCRLLNCGTVLSTPVNTPFGQGTEQIWLSDMRCNGVEAALDHCPANPYGNNNCSHSQDTSVICSGIYTKFPAVKQPKRFLCRSPVRLANGDTICSGRVEIFHNSTWGSVCRDGWDTEDARVVCRQLSCGNATSLTSPVSPSQASGQIWLKKMNCSGTENSLDQCPADPWGQHSCTHVVGVQCSGGGEGKGRRTRTYLSAGPVPPRLVHGYTRCSGTVELFHNSSWSGICRDHWDLQAVTVLCRQLNCGVAVSASTAFESRPGGLHVRCNGSESDLDQCVTSDQSANNCSHPQGATAICSGGVMGRLPVRLVGGNTMCSGRVEILYASSWGTVCDAEWDKKDGDVVCRELNCGETASAPSGAFFGRGNGTVWLDGVRCNGAEGSLDQCLTKPLANNTCPVPVRLVNGNNVCSGRVEVLHNSTWGSVCGDHWGTEEANVVCRLLNCGEATSATGNATFGQGTGPVWLSDVRCDGTETSIDQCSTKAYWVHSCHHGQDAGVTCSGKTIIESCAGQTGERQQHVLRASRGVAQLHLGKRVWGSLGYGGGQCHLQTVELWRGHVSDRERSLRTGDWAGLAV
uniref:Soluble scavenger receptor cysteine-rich domain-containing protein SSC5D n=1 Tax=Callorhinchus milii TaxID=7868 RepID=A0A4W3GKL4_CALMI